jgi:hypothetical protein
VKAGKRRGINLELWNGGKTGLGTEENFNLELWNDWKSDPGTESVRRSWLVHEFLSSTLD